jgi:hypothetical protein
VRLGVKGYADDIHEEGFAPLRELIASFVKAGGSLLALLQEARPRRHGNDDTATSTSAAWYDWSVAILMMQPPQDSGPINALAKAHVEVDGKPHADWTREFTYREIVR